jgi:opacity protein-like surface antigen
MKRVCIAALAACGFAAPAMAAPGNNYVDGYGFFSELDLESGPFDDSDDGFGMGVKGAFQIADRVFLTGEAQTVEYDDVNEDFDQIRLGAGFGPGMGPNAGGIYGRVEYVDVDIGFADDGGVGAWLGYGLPLNPQLRLYGEAGYLLLDDIDGPELLIGATYRIAQNFGLFADYRASFLEADVGPGEVDVEVSDFRLGVRFTF